MYVVHGKCKVIVEISKNTNKEYFLKKGEYIFLDGGIKHELSVEKGSPCRVLNLEMGKTRVRNIIAIRKLAQDSLLLSKFIKLGQPIVLGNDYNGDLHSIIVALQQQLQLKNESSENHIMTDLSMGQLFIELASQSNALKQNSSRNKYIKSALAFIEQSYDQEISVKAIAEEVHISSAHLQRIFKEAEGKSLIDHITSLRIEKAKLLLNISSIPIVDIAINVGFNNRQHFSYVFHKKVGCSPAVYRKTKGNSDFWEFF
jgi:AraC-like DNA-binding protein